MFKNHRTIAKLLALTVVLGGLLVIVGWVFDIGVLKSLSPAWAPMKFLTAVTFILSGVSLYFIVKALEGEYDKAQVVLSATSFIIILLMGLFFVSSLLQIHTGEEELFVKEAPGAVKTVTPGRPSLPTTLNFMLVGSAGIMTMLRVNNLQRKLRRFGAIIGGVGAIAILGYILNVPALYYYAAGINSAIACNTAILFVILGAGFTCL